MAFIAKLGKMRKAQRFSGMVNSDGSITAQSDKSIAHFWPETGKGILNIKGCYFVHLNKNMGAEEYTFPQDFVEAFTKEAVKPGEQIAIGVIMGSAPLSRL